MQEIQKIKPESPHVVILGAGCSKAAVPHGDANGKHLPIMADFLEVVPSVKDVLTVADIPIEGENFEKVYASLVASGQSELCSKIESLIFEYFSSLSLPNHPTIYDHLLLSLREKDVIATFNWDPFLLLALQRNLPTLSHTPQLLFLHGNVMVGFCKDHHAQGFVDRRCSKCGKFPTPSKLLYPVAEKNYEADPMIAASWNQLRADLNNAFMVTVFGYGAPISDLAAMNLMHEALGESEDNKLKMIEFIDIKPREEVLETWNPFIMNYRYHYKIHQDFYESYIPTHPRRTREAYVEQYLKGIWTVNPLPRDASLNELHEWIKAILKTEEPKP